MWLGSCVPKPLSLLSAPLPPPRQSGVQLHICAVRMLLVYSHYFVLSAQWPCFAGFMLHLRRSGSGFRNSTARVAFVQAPRAHELGAFVRLSAAFELNPIILTASNYHYLTIDPRIDSSDC